MKAFERSDNFDVWEFAQIGFGISLIFSVMSYQKKGIGCLVEVPSLKLIGFKVLPTIDALSSNSRSVNMSDLLKEALDSIIVKLEKTREK